MQAMTRKITITAGRREFRARLNETATARAIAEVLPIKAWSTRWGGEIYLSIPIRAALEGDAREVLEAGELAFWPPGGALCIFFGPTPVSDGGEIRAASRVNVVGRIEGDLEELERVADGAEVSLRAISEVQG